VFPVATTVPQTGVVRICDDCIRGNVKARDRGEFEFS
jgi:hypothetical protein